MNGRHTDNLNVIVLIILFNAIPLHPNSKIKSKARKQKPKKYIILSTAKIVWYEIYHSTYGSIIWNYENKWILCLFYISITFFKLLNKKNNHFPQPLNNTIELGTFKNINISKLLSLLAPKCSILTSQKYAKLRKSQNNFKLLFQNVWHLLVWFYYLAITTE